MKLNVNLADRSYDILIEQNAFDAAVAALAQRGKSGSKLVCIADSDVLKFHKGRISRLAEIAQIIPMEGGEGSKCFEKFAELCSELARLGVDRKSALVALGGGVVGDLTGFLAASYMRGIDFYQIPTTLLAMVDSSVGGKTGINIPEGKNLVGAFHQPKGVFADTEFLKTLPKREFAAGMAEVIKCGVLGDAELFKITAENGITPESPLLPEVIRRSCALKARVVADDERENAASGGRALLNLGHTFAHAIEKTSGYGTYLHGEAVAIGMVMAAQLSLNLNPDYPFKKRAEERERAYKNGEITPITAIKMPFLNNPNYNDIRTEIEKALLKNNLPIKLESNATLAEFMEAMSHDKKNAGGKLKFVLIEKIGKAFTKVVERADAEKVAKEFLK